MSGEAKVVAFFDSSLLSKNVIIEKRLPHMTVLLDSSNLPYYSRPKVTLP